MRINAFVPLSAAAFLLGAAGLCHAQDNDTVADLKQENAQLRRRVEALEDSLAEIKAMLKGLQESGGDRQDAGASGEAVRAEGLPREAAEQPKSVSPGPDKGKSTIRTNVDVDLYGYVKVDAAYDTSRVNQGNFARWVDREDENRNDNQFNLTANQTRLGLDLKGPQDKPVRSSGKVELDLYGAAPENKPALMIRHAYLKLDWPEQKFSILAGQTWDVISPLNPGTINYSVQWWAGNIGYRRPQIRATQLIDLSDQVQLKLEGALARAIGIATGFDPGDSGEDAGFPNLQGRVSLAFPLLTDDPTVIGVSGHWGEEELDRDVFGKHRTVNTWSFNVDWTQPVRDWIALQSEFFVGQNIDAYLGGIGQGVSTFVLPSGLVNYREIGTLGGWAAVRLSPWDNWTFNTGLSIEDISADDLTLSSQRSYNRAFFINGWYDINARTKVGLEISHWRTKYLDRGDGNSLRFQSSLLYSF